MTALDCNPTKRHPLSLQNSKLPNTTRGSSTPQLFLPHLDSDSTAHHAVRKARRARHQHDPHSCGMYLPLLPPLLSVLPRHYQHHHHHDNKLPRYRSEILPCRHHYIQAVTRDMAEQLLIQGQSTGRCHIPGQLWPSGRAHGHGPGGPRPVQQVHDFQPKEPRMGQPRSLCSLVRTCAYPTLFPRTAADSPQIASCGSREN